MLSSMDGLILKLEFYYIDGGPTSKSGRALHAVQRVSETDEVGRYQLYLADALASVVWSQSGCDQLSALIDDVASGRLDRAEYSDRDVELTITGTGVQVDIAINPDWVGTAEGCIGLGQWQVALAARRQFLGLPRASESAVEVRIPEPADDSCRA